MIVQSVGIFCIVVVAQVLLVSKAADLLSSFTSGERRSTGASA